MKLRGTGRAKLKHCINIFQADEISPDPKSKSGGCHNV
jgi:hypothetical protein